MKAERNYGIDLLRCLSMMMIVLLHLISHGGVMDGANGARYAVLSVIEVCVYGSVDIFAMISGYVMVTQEYKWKRIIPLWMETMFYSIACFAIVVLIFPAAFSLKTMAKALLPTLMREYWYFTSYFAMFFFIPFMNQLLNGKHAKELILTCVLLFSVLPTLIMQDPFGADYGYSPLWLGVCYIIGGYVRLYCTGVKKRPWVLGYLLLSAAVWCSKMVILAVGGRIGFGSSLSYYLLGYTSPLILGAAACLLLAFAGTEVKSEAFRKVISYGAAGSFAVYLIHESVLVRQMFVQDRFVWLNEINPVLSVVLLIVIAAAVFAVCAAADALRRAIFRTAPVRWLETAIYGLFAKKDRI